MAYFPVHFANQAFGEGERIRPSSFFIIFCLRILKKRRKRGEKRGTRFHDKSEKGLAAN